MLPAVRQAPRCGDCAVVVAPAWHNLELELEGQVAFCAGGLVFGNVESPAGIVLALLTRRRQLAFNPSSVGGGAP
jgi:hypothetical protein